MMKYATPEIKERIYEEFLFFLYEEQEFYSMLSDDNKLKKILLPLFRDWIYSFKKGASDIKIDVVSSFYRKSLDMVIKFEVEEDGCVSVQKYDIGEKK